MRKSCLTLIGRALTIVMVLSLTACSSGPPTHYSLLATAGPCHCGQKESIAIYSNGKKVSGCYEDDGDYVTIFDDNGIKEFKKDALP